MKTNSLPAMLLAIVLALLASAVSGGWTVQDLVGQPGVVSAEYIFRQAPFAQCHASTIAQTPSGLVAAWFGGSHEKNPDVGIWLSRRINGRWTPPVEVANGIQYRQTDGMPVRYPCWNPVLFQPPGKPLLLFYKCGPDPDAWWGMLMTSTDDGATWSLPRRLPVGILGPVKNKPVLLDDGTLVCPSSTEDHGWRLHMEFTRDLGITWSRTAPLNCDPPKGAIQPSILFHGSAEPGARGRWQLIARDHNKNGNLWTAWSDDQGKTWSELESTGLPNPSAGTDAITLTDGRQLLVYNHTHGRGPNVGQSRSVLNVAVSDDGVHWQAALVLERAKGEYAYPAVIQTPDGLVHVTYTWKRERIKHVVLDPAKLVLEPIVAGRWPQ